MNIRSGAVISDCQQYRYSLTRVWAENAPRACFIMLNPSIADATINDPTIRRCIGFAIEMGCGSLEVVNLFAFRATDPKAMKQADDPIGPENDRYLIEAAQCAAKVICAWGTHGKFYRRDREVAERLTEAGIPLLCLGETAHGHPKHPLYLAANTEPVEWRPR